MAMQRYMIAPYDQESGLTKNREPWLIPDKAFSKMKNAYVFRGRIRKRFGGRYLGNATSQLQSRFRIQIDTTNGSGAASGTVPGSAFAVGQMFSIGNEIYTVNATGTPATLLTTGNGTGTYNTSNGAYSFTGAPATTAVFFYPALPVMGLPTLETSNRNNNRTFGFDTTFAYEYTSSGWARRGTATWTGSDADFFYATNYRSTAFTPVLFVTNNVDPVRWWDDAGSTWNNLTPIYSGTDTIQTARIVIPFQNRLLLLNTVEQVGGVDRRFANRCRFSEEGDPTAAGNWNQDNGIAGAIDAATSEEIIGVDFIKNHLIVFFEKSTWEIVYTGVTDQPFGWQQLNSELGAESGFSVVPFDKVTLGIASNGVHACNGSNVERIDSKIPDEVFGFQNVDSGPFRVYGIRDYFTELVYWSYPGSGADAPSSVYPNQVLIYNYNNGTWAINDDAITSFGYYQNVSGLTWEEVDQTWEEAGFLWNGPSTIAQFRQVIAGNQEGYTFIVDSGISENAPVLQLTDVADGPTLTIINHTLSAGDFIKIENAVWSDGSSSLNGNIYKVDSVTDADTIVLDTQVNNPTFTGIYEGGGTITRVSRVDIETKEFNFFVNQDRNMYISRVDFQLNSTTAGGFSVDYFVSTYTQGMVSQAETSGALLGTSIVETAPYDVSLIPFETGQTRLWHPIYLQADGEFIKLRLYFNEDQMIDTSSSQSDWTLHAMTFFATPSASRLQ